MFARWCVPVLAVADASIWRACTAPGAIHWPRQRNNKGPDDPRSMIKIEQFRGRCMPARTRAALLRNRLYLVAGVLGHWSRSLERMVQEMIVQLNESEVKQAVEFAQRARESSRREPSAAAQQAVKVAELLQHSLNPLAPTEFDIPYMHTDDVLFLARNPVKWRDLVNTVPWMNHQMVTSEVFVRGGTWSCDPQRLPGGTRKTDLTAPDTGLLTDSIIISGGAVEARCHLSLKDIEAFVKTVPFDLSAALPPTTQVSIKHRGQWLDPVPLLDTLKVRRRMRHLLEHHDQSVLNSGPPLNQTSSDESEDEAAGAHEVHVAQVHRSAGSFITPKRPSSSGVPAPTHRVAYKTRKRPQARSASGTSRKRAAGAPYKSKPKLARGSRKVAAPEQPRSQPPPKPPRQFQVALPKPARQQLPPAKPPRQEFAVAKPRHQHPPPKPPRQFQLLGQKSASEDMPDEVDAPLPKEAPSRPHVPERTAPLPADPELSEDVLPSQETAAEPNGPAEPSGLAESSGPAQHAAGDDEAPEADKPSSNPPASSPLEEDEPPEDIVQDLVSPKVAPAKPPRSRPLGPILLSELKPRKGPARSAAAARASAQDGSQGGGPSDKRRTVRFQEDDDEEDNQRPDKRVSIADSAPPTAQQTTPRRSGSILKTPVRFSGGQTEDDLSEESALELAGEVCARTIKKLQDKKVPVDPVFLGASGIMVHTNFEISLKRELVVEAGFHGKKRPTLRVTPQLGLVSYPFIGEWSGQLEALKTMVAQMNSLKPVDDSLVAGNEWCSMRRYVDGAKQGTSKSVGASALASVLKTGFDECRITEGLQKANLTTMVSWCLFNPRDREPANSDDFLRPFLGHAAAGSVFVVEYPRAPGTVSWYKKVVRRGASPAPLVAAAEAFVCSEKGSWEPWSPSSFQIPYIKKKVTAAGLLEQCRARSSADYRRPATQVTPLASALFNLRDHVDWRLETEVV